MTGKEINNLLLTYWEPMFEQEGFTLKSKKYTFDNPPAFQKKIGSANFTYFIRFLKYGKIEPHLKITFDETDALYKQLIGDKSQHWAIFYFNLLYYINPENQNDTYESIHAFDSPRRDDIINGSNLEISAKEIFEILFKQPIPRIIERIGTLQKADEILNIKPVELINGEIEPRWLTYCGNIILQAFSGILVAKATKRTNFNEVLEQYISFFNQFEEGEYDEVDLIRNNLSVLRA